jgi:tRNA nucleotidyltransferase (CCA-adding enzyme)
MTNNIKFWKVGGCVRDTFLGVPSKDVDFAVEAESFNAMKAAIWARGGKIFLETPEFFTIRAKVPELGAADFVLCRKDGAYRDGRRPEFVEVGTIEDDLARRDFTMNAIAINAEDECDVRDPFGGIDDIAHRVIRAVGNPVVRFDEDKLRVFRALRFSITKGFRIDTETVEAMLNTTDFSGVSTERIREEVLKMCEVDSVGAIIKLTNFGLIDLVKERGIWFKPTTEKV